MNIRLILSILLALLTPVIIFPERYPAVITEQQIIALFLFFPAMVSSIVIAVSCINKKAFRPLYNVTTLTLCLALVMPISFGALCTSSHLKATEKKRRDAWFEYDRILIPHIIDYIRINPGKVTFPHNDDRTFIRGVGKHLNEKQSIITCTDNEIIDPWGNPIWLIIDHDNNMKLEFNDHFFGIDHIKGNELVVALVTQKQYSLRKRHHQWQLN